LKSTEVEQVEEPFVPPPFEVVPVIKGDSKEYLIAAASIIAKVTRDRYCRSMEEKFPGYGFAAHKGYGTKQHMKALATLGACIEHRKSYEPVRKVLEGDTALTAKATKTELAMKVSSKTSNTSTATISSAAATTTIEPQVSKRPAGAPSSRKSTNMTEEVGYEGDEDNKAQRKKSMKVKAKNVTGGAAVSRVRKAKGSIGTKGTKTSGRSKGVKPDDPHSSCAADGENSSA